MGLLNRRCFRLALGVLALAWACMALAPIAEAQFFWWFDQPKKAAPKARKAKPPGDDLPPIVPRESSAPPPPDDRPYDAKLMRLAEILGAVHYLRELCGAEEGQIWRDQMKEILRNEGTTAVRRAKLVNSFNDGYRGYRRTYRSCTQSATLATTRFSTEGASIAASLAQGGSFRSSAPAEPKPEAGPETNGASLPSESNAGQAVQPTADAQVGDQTGGLAPADQAAAPPPAPQADAPAAGQADTPVEEPPD
jgi:uncharacterized protein (TIGR02301 family)